MAPGYKTFGYGTMVSGTAARRPGVCRSRVGNVSRSIHFNQKLVVIKGFDQKGEGAGGHNGALGCAIIVTGDKNCPRRRRSCAEMDEQFHSGHAGHPDIEDHDPDRIGCEEFEKDPGLAKDVHV